MIILVHLWSWFSSGWKKLCVVSGNRSLSHFLTQISSSESIWFSFWKYLVPYSKHKKLSWYFYFSLSLQFNGSGTYTQNWTQWHICTVYCNSNNNHTACCMQPRQVYKVHTEYLKQITEITVSEINTIMTVTEKNGLHMRDLASLKLQFQRST